MVVVVDFVLILDLQEFTVVAYLGEVTKGPEICLLGWDGCGGIKNIEVYKLFKMRSVQRNSDTAETRTKMMGMQGNVHGM